MRTALLVVLALCVGMAIKSSNSGITTSNPQEAIEQAADVAYAHHDYRLSQNLRTLIQIHEKDLDESCYVDLRLFITGQLDDVINQIQLNESNKP